MITRARVSARAMQILQRLAICIILVLASLAPLAARPSAAVLVNHGAEEEASATEDMAKTLDTSVSRKPSKRGFLNELASSDIVYVNTHMYGASGGHVIDRLKGRRGTIVVGDTALLGYNDRDLVTRNEVREALQKAGHTPALVVLVGCSADAYGWRGVTGARVEILFTKPIVGEAGDIYFSYFFKAWASGKTVEEALAYADKHAFDHPQVKKHDILLGNALRGLIANRVVHGDGKALYGEPAVKPTPSPTPSPSPSPSPSPTPSPTPPTKPSPLIVKPDPPVIKLPSPTPTVVVTPTPRPSATPLPARPLRIGISGPQLLEVGEVGAWRANVSGGRPPYRITWHKGTTGSTYRGRASKAGNYRISISVRDSGARSTTPLEVGTWLKIVDRLSVRISGPRRAQAGQRIQLSASASGGVGSYEVQWRGPKGGTVRNRWSLSGSLDKPGRYAYMVEVWDKGRHTRSGRPATATTVVEVVAKPAGRPGGLSDVDVSQRNIQMGLRDHGRQDGDVITVRVNGRVVASGLRLTNRGYGMNVTLQPGPNVLEVFAHNEGDSSPNTAELRFSHIVRGSSVQHYNLKKGQTARMVLKAP